LSDPTQMPNNQKLSAGLSSLVDICLRLVDIQKTVTVVGMDRPMVAYAWPFPPSTSDSSLCPFFVNDLTRGVSDIGEAGGSPPSGTGQQARDSQIDMYLCVERKEGNVDLKWAVWDTALWVDATYAAFAQHLRLSSPSTGVMDIPSIVDAKIKAWELVHDYELSGAVYLAIKFSLAVRERYAQPMKS
jgi:hypothetical protein